MLRRDSNNDIRGLYDAVSCTRLPFVAPGRSQLHQAAVSCTRPPSVASGRRARLLGDLTLERAEVMLVRILQMRGHSLLLHRCA